MFTRLRIILVVLGLGLLLPLVGATAPYGEDGEATSFTQPNGTVPNPAWWVEFNVLNENDPPDSYAAANIGQLKYMAKKACEAMETYGDAGTEITALINGFTPGDDYAMINIGQLKAVAKPFYDRLRLAYTWTAGSDDYAIANVGQLKYVFSFDIGTLQPPTPSGMVLVQDGTLPSIGNGVITVPDFYIGQYEVTWGEWNAVRTWAVENDYGLSDVGEGCADNHPVHP